MAAGRGTLATYAVNSQLHNFQLPSNCELPSSSMNSQAVRLEELGVVALGVDSYLLYSSTISCSCTGRLICSRVGSEAMRPAMAPESNESHSGTPRPLTSSSACWIAGFCALRSWTPTVSPGLTE